MRKASRKNIRHSYSYDNHNKTIDTNKLLNYKRKNNTYHLCIIDTMIKKGE